MNERIENACERLFDTVGISLVLETHEMQDYVQVYAINANNYVTYNVYDDGAIKEVE